MKNEDDKTKKLKLDDESLSQTTEEKDLCQKCNKRVSPPSGDIHVDDSLTMWGGTCRICKIRCCTLCLGGYLQHKDMHNPLCNDCEKTHAECTSCSKIVEKKELIPHPMCISEGPCSFYLCSKCMKKCSGNCPGRCCDSDSEIEEGSQDCYECPNCSEVYYYEGDNCVLCKRDCCYSCIDPNEKICTKCKQSNRQCENCAKIEDKKEMKRHPSCESNEICCFYCKKCGKDCSRKCPGCGKE